MDAETFGKCQVPSFLLLMNPSPAVMDLKEQMQLSVGYIIFPEPKSTFELLEMISLSSLQEMKVCLFKVDRLAVVVRFDDSRIAPIK